MAREDGFTAGLQFWLFFLIALVLLEFPLAYAIVFGAIAGMAGGFAVGWWQGLGRQTGAGYSDLAVTLDAQRLIELDEPEGDSYSRGEAMLRRRRANYVSNRPYDRDSRKRTVNGWLSWRRSSRPRGKVGQEQDRDRFN